MVDYINFVKHQANSYCYKKITPKEEFIHSLVFFVFFWFLFFLFIHQFIDFLSILFNIYFIYFCIYIIQLFSDERTTHFSQSSMAKITKIAC